MPSSPSATRLPRWRRVRSALQQPSPAVAESVLQFDPVDDFEPVPPSAVRQDEELPPEFIDALGFSPDPSMPFDEPSAISSAPSQHPWRLGPRVVALNLGPMGSEPPARLRRLPHALGLASQTDID